MKKLLITLLVAAMLLVSPAAQGAGNKETLTWFIKRNGNCTPGFSSSASMVDEYNGYYIDKKAADAEEKVLYLTFDAGYENGNIEKILDVLQKEDVPAAFFVLDNLIIKNTDLVKRMAEDGHLVCNHTKNHRNLTRCTEEVIRNDLTDLEKIYEERTERSLDKFFRFPEGKFSEDALRAVSNMGYTTVFWSFAYDDWDNNRQPKSEQAIKKILDNTHNGAIILLHPTSDTNAEILPSLIKSWRKMGYTFGTLYDLVK